MRYFNPVAACAIAICSIAGCSDSPTGQVANSLQVSVTTTGGDPDENGYELVVDGTRRFPLGVSGDYLVEGIIDGAHAIALDGVADNCLVADRVRTVTVKAGTTISFAVACETTGVMILTRTTGKARGDYIALTANGSVIIRPNGSALVTRLRPGKQEVSLSGVAGECSLVESGVATVEITNRSVTQVTFAVKCPPSTLALLYVEATPGQFGPTFALWAADSIGGGAVHLGPGVTPSWSPDGTRVVYVDRYCDPYEFEGLLLGLCASNLILRDFDEERESATAHFQNALDPTWSPDGKAITYLRPTSDEKSLSQVITGAVDGSASFLFTAPSWAVSQPAWSPDGKRLVFGCMYEYHNGLTELCIANKDGGDFRRLTNHVWDGHPAWSPDGKLIVFATHDRGWPEREIAVMSPDGGAVTRIAKGFDPSWIPGTSKIVFAGDNGIFTISADGTGLRRITTGRHSAPVWRPKVVSQ